LYWQVDTPTTADLTVKAQLTTSQGAMVETKQSTLGSAFPTSRWQGGRTVATYVDLPIPVTALSGALQPTLQFAAPGGASVVVSTFPALKIVARPRTYTVPPIPVPRQADFAGSIALLGYGLQPATDGTIKPGQTIDLSMYWKDVKGMTTSYKVFTHLLGPDGRIYGQEDAIPLNGNAPTNGWLPGEILTDHYQITVAANAPPGNYQIVVGFYDPISGVRLSLTNGQGDTFALTSLHLAGTR
ncbi:MAG TPA: hypothetical protein VMW65_05300, partial [Chloroflexota bacterium]|nr:hypothetical protein [Chloroflexota bacterium]